MMRLAFRFVVVVGLCLVLVPGISAQPVFAAWASLSTGWSISAMGPPASDRGSISLPFFVVRGGPGVVAISQSAGSNTASVWVSADGRRWRYKALDPRAFANVVALAALALGKHGLVMAGITKGTASPQASPLPQGVVWTSTNGLSWRRVPDAGGVFKGATLRSVTAGGPGYVAAGTVETQASPAAAITRRAAIWTSPDGMHWQPASGAGAGFGGAFINAVTAGGPGLVAAGFASSTFGHPPVAAIWTSTTGRTWRRVAAGRVFGSGGIDQLVSSGRALIALGHDFPAGGLQHQIIWTSHDGLHWRRGTTDPFGLNHGPPAITALGSGFAAAGVYDNAPALWTSADGSRWTLAAGSDIFGGGFTMLSGATTWRNGLVVVGERANPPIQSARGGERIVNTATAWLWTPGTPNAPHPDWAASDPLWFRVRLADLGPGFIPRTASYGLGCALLPDMTMAARGRFRPAVRPQFEAARCQRAQAALNGSIVYSFNFGYGTSNLFGPEPEVTGFAILARNAAQARTAYRYGGGLVIAGDLNLNVGTPHVEGSVKMAQGGTFYSIATQGFGTAYAVVWRAGRALGMVEVVGVPGNLKARAIALARAQWRHWQVARR